MKSSSSLLLLLLLFVVVAHVKAHDFSTCKSLKNDGMGVKSVSFVPDPPQSGKSVKVTVKGRPLLDIAEGSLHVDVRVLGVTVQSQIMDVCQVLKCPIHEGQEYEGTVEQDIPEGTPSHMGATVRISLISNGQTVSCLESYVQISNAVLGDTTESVPSEKPMDVLKADVQFLYSRWRKQFPKAAANIETFARNLEKILKHNAQKEKTFEMALNEFASMTEEEFVRSRMGVREPKQDVERNGPIPPRTTMLRTEVSLADPPKELDWTTKGVVSPVKNQGSCGSCWAFSAIGAIESAYAIKTGNIIRFSEQELVSCDDTDFGCQGGLMDSAFDWIERSTTGLCKEEEYAYTSGTTSARGECLKSSCTPVPGSVPKGYVDIPPNEASLLAHLTEHGPVSVAIQADQSAFQFYHKGVLTGQCGTHLNHGVLLVGFGVDVETGTPFWKVKNSWGAGWGEEGYIRIQRGKRWPIGGQCGIATKASYPIL